MVEYNMVEYHNVKYEKVEYHKVNYEKVNYHKVKYHNDSVALIPPTFKGLSKFIGSLTETNLTLLLFLFQSSCQLVKSVRA